MYQIILLFNVLLFNFSVDIEQCCIIGQEQNGQILYSYHKRHFDKVQYC